MTDPPDLVVVHFLAIVFLRFSALAKMARRTSWWLKARGNYGRLSVFNLYSASHPLWQSIWPNVPTSELLLKGVHGCLNQALVFVLCNCLLLEYVEQRDGVFIRGSIIAKSVRSTDVRNCRILEIQGAIAELRRFETLRGKVIEGSK